MYDPPPHCGVGSPDQHQQQQNQPITNAQKELKSTFASSTHFSARFEFFSRASFRQSSLIEVMANARLLNSRSPLPCVFYKKRSMNDLKLLSLNERNLRLREDHERPRIKEQPDQPNRQLIRQVLSPPSCPCPMLQLTKVKFRWIGKQCSA